MSDELNDAIEQSGGSPSGEEFVQHDPLHAVGEPTVDHRGAQREVIEPDGHSGTSSGAAHHGDLSLLNDVGLVVTVELGRTSMRVRDVLQLGEGSVLELDRPAGAPADVLVNGTLIARGDVVMVADELGIRVTEIVDPPIPRGL